MRRVFVDANVLIAGAGSTSGASNAVLRMAELGLFTLVVSRQALDETERNLRKKLPRALPVFAAQLAAIGPQIVSDPPPEDTARWERVIAAKDAPILAAAVSASVDRLLTLDAGDFTPAVAEQSCLVIQTPARFIEEIRAVIDAGL